MIILACIFNNTVGIYRAIPNLLNLANRRKDTGNIDAYKQRHNRAQYTVAHQPGGVGEVSFEFVSKGNFHNTILQPAPRLPL